MEFWFSRGASGKRKGILVLRLSKEGVDFLLFQNQSDGVRVLAHGSEGISHFSARQALEKVFLRLPKIEAVQELVATFDPDSFRARVIQQSIPPSSSSHIIDAAEVRSIEKQVRERALRVFQKHLFQESGILPNEFSLRRVSILRRSMNGYSVPKLEGFKRGEITFSLLGVFLLESAFVPFEQFAKAHSIPRVRVAHTAEALEAFARTQNREGVYVDMEEERTQVAVWKEGHFVFPGDIPMGASHFTEFFSSVFGMPHSAAQELQEQYFREELSQTVREKVHTSLLPEIQKFGTLVKEKLMETRMALPDSVWIFGKGRALRDIQGVFREDELEDLPFSRKPSVHFLLPKDVWEGKRFAGANDLANTALCLLGRLAMRGN